MDTSPHGKDRSREMCQNGVGGLAAGCHGSGEIFQKKKKKSVGFCRPASIHKYIFIQQVNFSILDSLVVFRDKILFRYRGLLSAHV